MEYGETRQCLGCSEVLPIERFALKHDKSNPTLRRARCRYCYRKTVSPQKAQRAAVSLRSKKNRARRHQVLLREAKNKACADCGERYPYWVMQFDHLPQYEKLFGLASTAAYRTEAVLLAEIAKCEVVCANCHAERTHARHEGEPKQMTLAARPLGLDHGKEGREQYQEKQRVAREAALTGLAPLHEVISFAPGAWPRSLRT